MKLFRGNPNLIEISIRGNNLQQLEAAQLPLDRLHRLNIARNPFVCNCSLLWLWRLTHDQLYSQHPNDGESNNNEESTDMTFKPLSTLSKKFPDQNQNLDPRLINSNQIDTMNNNVLILDVDEMGCNQWESSKKFTRHLLKELSASDMKCPAPVATIVCAIISVLLVLVTAISIFYYIRLRNRRSAMSERKNVNERIVPQKVDKSELERYLAAQEMENEYRALRRWEVTPKEQVEEPDHYEECNNIHYDMRRTQKPHVVYV